MHIRPRVGRFDQLQTWERAADDEVRYARSPCQHVAAVVEAIMDDSATEVTHIKFGVPRGQRALAALKEDLVRLELLSRDQADVVKTGEYLTTEDGVPILVRIGDTGFFAVRDGRSRSVGERWGHIQSKCSEAMGPSRQQRTMGPKDFACKVGAHARHRYGRHVPEKLGWCGETGASPLSSWCCEKCRREGEEAQESQRRDWPWDRLADSPQRLRSKLPVSPALEPPRHGGVAAVREAVRTCLENEPVPGRR